MWIKADDKLANHPKILRAGKLIGPDGPVIALGFFHWCLSYSNEYSTDGFLADEVISGCRHCKKPEKLAQILAESFTKIGGSGLFERVAGGYQIHDYHDYNPTLEKVAQLQEKKRLAGHEGGIRSGEIRKQKGKQTGSTCFASASPPNEANAQANAKQNSSSRARSRPVPSRPVLPEGTVPDGHAPPGPVENSDRTNQPDDSPPLGPDGHLALPAGTPNERLIEAVIRLDALPTETTDDVTEADLVENVKTRCARLSVPYDAATVGRAIESERFKTRTGLRRGS